MNNKRLRDLLTAGLDQLCDDYDYEAVDKLLAYMDLTLETNKSMNLTAITEPEDFIIRHYIDSLAICKSEAYRNAGTVIDVGTGGGFPGIVLAAASPGKDFVLMDSLNKRVKFIERVAAEVGISNVSTVHSRAEDLGRAKGFRDSFDLCVSRAVANLSVLSEFCLPLVKPGGYFAAYKTYSEDLALGYPAIEALGGKPDHTEAFPALKEPLDFIDSGHRIIFVKKIKATEKKYPRKPGKVVW